MSKTIIFGTFFFYIEVSKLKSFKRLVKEDDILSSEFNLHSLRKSCASYLFQQGKTLKEVQNWLGHAEGSAVTLAVYTKVKEKSKANIADTMSGLFIG